MREINGKKNKPNKQLIFITGLIIFVVLVTILIKKNEFSSWLFPSISATSIPEIQNYATPSSATPTHDLKVETPTPYIFFKEGKTIQLAWFAKPPQNGDALVLAQNFDLVILTIKDEPIQHQLRDLGITNIQQYFRIDAIKNPGSCTAEANGNQVAYKAGDFCWISAQHPDWFLQDSKGNQIYDRGIYDEYVFMDPGNQEWREFFLERVIESQNANGWYGVFLDNVDASLGRMERKGITLAAYPDDAGFQAAIGGFLKFLYESYFQPSNRPLYANIVSNRNFNTWFRYLNYLDGAMDEGWGVDWSDGYRSVTNWEEHLTRAERTQDRGKKVILVAQGDKNDYQRQNFAFASYLLVNHGRAYFRYANSDSYHEIWLYPNYEMDIGYPLGPRYKEDEIWRRDFSKGSILVDPNNLTVEIITP